MAIQTATQFQEPNIVQLIVFRVGAEEFAIPIGEVREIIKAGVVTPVPDSPSFIRGLINVRGDIVATIDLRARFSMKTRDTANTKHIIITRQQDTLFGLMVDEVTEVLRVPESEIKKAPKAVRNLREAYVNGVLPLENRLIVLLNLARVLSEEELARVTEFNRRPLESGEQDLAESSGNEPDEDASELFAAASESSGEQASRSKGVTA